MDVNELQHALGRFSFAFQALETLRPFLGPFYAWAAAAPENAQLPPPAFLKLIAAFLAKVLQAGHRVEPVDEIELAQVAFMADAKAQDQLVTVRGHSVPESGNLWDAKWFAEAVNSKNAPWAFAKDQPFKLIASLGMLASTMSLIACAPTTEKLSESRLVLTGVTDNQGSAALSRRP